jgi:ABC-type antimicrobial peptide transport system permease subunit
MQLPILQGRNFTGQDASKTQSVAIVNEAWVKEFLPKGGDPLTHAFDNGADSPSTAIVGVSGSGRQNIFEPTQAEIDFPISQLPDYLRAFVPSFYLFVRTTVTPASIVPQLREALHKVSPDIAFRTPEKMEDVLSDALVANRMQSWLFGLFAGLAVLLTVVGIYGLLMQEVVSQTRDIGVRMALGATRMQIVQKMLLRLGALLGIGLGAGICLTLLLRRVAGSILAIQFAHDSELIAGLVALLAVIGLLAAVAPLRRAASVDPMRTLRME